jgi:hypothetical protein
VDDVLLDCDTDVVCVVDFRGDGVTVAECEFDRVGLGLPDAVLSVDAVLRAAVPVTVTLTETVELTLRESVTVTDDVAQREGEPDDEIVVVGLADRQLDVTGDAEAVVETLTVTVCVTVFECATLNVVDTDGDGVGELLAELE